MDDPATTGTEGSPGGTAPARRVARWLPPTADRNALVLVQARAVRALADGLVSVVLSAYLVSLGLTATQVGVVITSTLLGSAALSLAVGFGATAWDRRMLLVALSVVMVVTGLAFATVTAFWALVAIALVGTINPSSGDVSAFYPTEQAALPDTVAAHDRTALFARYSLLAAFAAALGSAAAGIPHLLGERGVTTEQGALRGVFVAYAVLGAVALMRYRSLTPAPVAAGGRERHVPLGPSRRTVYRLAALFSIDSFGSGFTITAIVVLWLQRRFDLSLAVSGAVFFWAGLLAAWSQLLAPALARRIGLVRTMVFTHIPANLLLISAALMPTAPLAIACLLGRSLLSQMDVPARSSYVMAVVEPDERRAAASVTSVPRSLVSAFPPALAGWMLTRTDIGLPLVVGGGIKIVYDLLLLVGFRHHRPPEEHARAATR